MNRIYILFFGIIIILVISISNTFAVDKPSDEQIQASNAFKRLVESSHPTPVDYPAIALPMVPLLENVSSPIFLNSDMTDNNNGKGQSQMQNESSIAVNPLNPKNIISSAVDYRDTSATWVYVSSDGGLTWNDIKLGRPFKGWLASNDPSVAFDMDNTGYMVYGGFGTTKNDSNGVMYGENGVFLSKTTDQGKTWKAHIPIILHRGTMTLDSTFEDKYYITVDNSQSSSYFKNCYVPWKRVTPKDSATQIVISRSTDKGETWSVPVPVSHRLSHTSEDTTYGQSFPLAITGPNGEVYVIWNNGVEHGVGFAVSKDGGLTFSEPKFIEHYQKFGQTTYYKDQKVWRHTVKGCVRAESYPSMVCDTRPGSRQGWLYLTWAGDNPPNIYFSRSTDGGNNWSQPQFVSSDTTNDQFFQWIAMDPENGDLAVIYLDSRKDTANIMTNCYVSYSSDGGSTWIDRCVSDTSFDLRLNPFTGNTFAGDYNGCAFSKGIIYPSWVDMRHAVVNIFDSDVFTALIKINSPLPPLDFTAKTIPDKPTEIDLSWKPTTESSFGKPISTSDIKYALFRNNIFFKTFDGNVTSYQDTGLNEYTLYNYSICSYTTSDSSIFVKSSAFAGGSRLPAVPVILSVNGTNDNTVQIQVKLPSKREDGITPLVNLNEIGIMRDSVFIKTVQVMQTDTGKILTFEDKPPERGYYSYITFVKDKNQPSNQSKLSNELTLYTGPIENHFEESFASPTLAHYLRTPEWGISTKYFHTPDYSLTESPKGDYENSKQYKLTLFPIKLGAQEPLELKLWHLAYVHYSDTSFIEISYDNGSTWNILGKYNRKSFAPWQDSTYTQDDWKPETFVLQPSNNDIALIRFRLKTNVVRNDDGWYIDDIVIDKYSSVETVSLTQSNIKLFPNPCNSFLNIDFSEFYNDFAKIKIINIFGEIVFQRDLINTNSLETLNLSNLPQGAYFLSIESTGNNKFNKMITIVR